MADEKEFDPWHLTTGLAEKYTGVIKDPTFGFKADYMDGTRLLFLIEVQTDDDEIGENGLVNEQYTVGDGWEAKDKGLRCAREDGKKKGFNQNSGYGLFIAAAVQAGAGEVLKARSDADGPMKADIWEGLSFDFERKTFTFKNDKGEDQSYHRMLPVKFHGESGKGQSQSSSMSSKTAEATSSDESSSATNGNSGGNYGLDAGLLAKIKARAKKAGTHDEFIELCFGELGDQMTGVAEDVVMDAGGLYAEVHS